MWGGGGGGEKRWDSARESARQDVCTLVRETADRERSEARADRKSERVERMARGGEVARAPMQPRDARKTARVLLITITAPVMHINSKGVRLMV